MYKSDDAPRDLSGRFASHVGKMPDVELTPEDIEENLRHDKEHEEFLDIEGKIQDYLGEHYPELLGVLVEQAGPGDDRFIGVRYAHDEVLGSRAGKVELFDEPYGELRTHLEDKYSGAMLRLQEHGILDEYGDLVCEENEIIKLGSGDHLVYHVGWPKEL